MPLAIIETLELGIPMYPTQMPTNEQEVWEIAEKYESRYVQVIGN